jgi:hypothetical protein
MFRRTCSLLFASLAIMPVMGQTTNREPATLSVCELAAHPERYDNKQVTLKARYSANWEWGAWIHDGDGGCKDVLRFGLPSSFWIPNNYSGLKIQRDDGFREFDKKSSLLCNGMEAFCDFDYIEAEFTGTFIAARHLQELRIHGDPPTSAVVVTKVSGTKLHINQDGMLHASPIPLPDVIVR